MTTAMDDVSTAGDVSRMTGVPDSALQDCAAKRERGVDWPGPHHCKLSSRHRRWCVLMLWNGSPPQGFER